MKRRRLASSIAAGSVLAIAMALTPLAAAHATPISCGFLGTHIISKANFIQVHRWEGRQKDGRPISGDRQYPAGTAETYTLMSRGSWYVASGGTISEKRAECF